MVFFLRGVTSPSCPDYASDAAPYPNPQQPFQVVTKPPPLLTHRIGRASSVQGCMRLSPPREHGATPLSTGDTRSCFSVEGPDAAVGPATVPEPLHPGL